MQSRERGLYSQAYKSCHKQQEWDVCSSNPRSKRIRGPAQSKVSSRANQGEEGQHGPRCRWHVEDRESGKSMSTQHPADSAEPETQQKTEAAKPTASTSPS